MHLVLFEFILFSQVFEFRLRISSCDSDNQTSTFCEMLYFFYGWKWNQPKVKVHLQDCNTLYNAHSYEPNWESNERKVCYGSMGMGMKHNHASHKWSTSHLHRQELSFEWENHCWNSDLAFLRLQLSVLSREANFSGFRFIAINDKFGPIYRDKFDKIR